MVIGQPIPDIVTSPDEEWDWLSVLLFPAPPDRLWEGARLRGRMA